MSKFDNKQDLAAKIEWEGGVFDAALYGIRSTDLPEGTPQNIIDAWQHLEAVIVQEEMIINWLDEE